MNVLEASYAYCEGVARREAKNFYYSFLLLRRDQRRAMCAIYAFMRYCDDLSDAEGIEYRGDAMTRWRRQLEIALQDRIPDHPVWAAFVDTVRRYQIPHKYFLDMIDGVSSDLQPRRIVTFEELYEYCYRVASVVGLTIIHIFGFHQREALKLAEKCGIAFQLTNILRDVREDAVNQRVYLPEEDLGRFGVPPEDLLKAQVTRRLRELLKFEAERARAYFTESAPLVGMIDARSRSSLKALIGSYSALLDRIVASNYEVLRKRIRVPAAQKIWILVRSRF